MSEWNHNKRWNPFNSYKLLTHVDEWKRIQRGGRIPPPILVTVDPTNKCNLNCHWCNAAYIRKSNTRSLSSHILERISRFLPFWGGQGPGVRAVCVAGGGEPLINPHVGTFINDLVSRGISVGVVTNGVLIDKFIEPLSKCTWVGISIDAGSKETYERYKGVDKFDQVISNIESLVEYAEKNQTTLGSSKPSYGVSYKYLLYNDNIAEVYRATQLAKISGCKNIHFRPAGTPWDKIGSEKSNIAFDGPMIEMFNDEIQRAQELDSSNFGVYGITHKFDSQFQRANHFSACHAIFMTAVFEPPTIDGDYFTLGLCCDRRGDKKLELLHNCSNPSDINFMWGSKEHWNIHDRIKVSQCPRCTYQPHNEIYENVILKDSMTHKFI